MATKTAHVKINGYRYGRKIILEDNVTKLKELTGQIFRQKVKKERHLQTKLVQD